MSYNLCKWAFACGFLGLSLQAAEPPAIQPGKVSSITSAGTMNSGGFRGPNRNGIFPATNLCVFRRKPDIRSD